MAEAIDEVVVDEPSIDDTIRETLRGINERNSNGDETVIKDVAVEATPIEKVDTRARDESGKFVTKEQPAAPEQASQPNAQEATAPVAAAPDEFAKIDLNRPPSSYKPAAKAQWANIPLETRQEIYRRENSIHANFGEMKPMADFGRTIKDTVEPYRMLIEAEGGTPEKAIADTMRTAALFRVGTQQQKMGALYQIDKQFNCGFQEEFNRLVQREVARVTGQPQTQQQPQPQQFHDPRVDQLLQSQEQDKQRRAQEFSAQASDAENRFRSAMENGQPKYPFVDNVQDAMIAMIPDLRRSNPALSHLEILDKAYDAAVWANPETRAVLVSQQQAQAIQPVANQQKVEAARRASAVNVPKRGALPATGPAKSIDETIRETGQALGMF